ncbi:hypothetical protein BGW36DRAFT_300844 [Talaromyces proteolyticus]|uniref:Uncharacterized protein n=1 Tax=Talaromyces proteolyticus TaxID=1131652 RepID=A0AAD4KK32_9EURO|nr:uncharacterized protein BGW36DRAFT_300844 [Talaromyces proteolyticus]KAH8694155.1 hypothetical protein BGW36DRAFT_300844 [Talaromyces proteolyticus]
MQPGADITTVEMPSASLCAETAKINPTEWFPAYQSCVRHFLNVAQHTPKTQSLAALVNILLPCQRTSDPVSQYTPTCAVSLIPYIRRLVITAADAPPVLQELFGEEWYAGIGPLHSQERVNYLFTAKSGGWLETKAHYDMTPHETVPFLRPLRDPQEEELRAADARWSQWLAMEDWMVGPRSPFEEMTEN